MKREGVRSSDEDRCRFRITEPRSSIDHSLADRNVVGVFVTSNDVGTAVRVSNSTITNNSLFGIEQQGGSVVTSLSNNFVYANPGGETFGLTTIPK